MFEEMDSVRGKDINLQVISPGHPLWAAWSFSQSLSHWPCTLARLEKEEGNRGRGRINRDSVKVIGLCCLGGTTVEWSHMRTEALSIHVSINTSIYPYSHPVVRIREQGTEKGAK